MRVPVSWLRELVRVDADVHAIARRLAVSTLEVDRVIELGVPDVGENLDHFRVGKVVAAGKHPNADRLQLTQVDVGEGEPRQIVCGAWNFGAGATVAVALPGAQLPGAEGPLKQAKLRGEASHGMILSERELELGSDHGGIMVLQDGIEPGTPLRDVLPLRDEVLDVTPTRNRVDLLSMVGIAREVALLFEAELLPIDVDDPFADAAGGLDVAIEDTLGCPRYIGRAFRDVAVGPSPVWLRARLHACGMRPISNVVDVTNYVMHAYGSPLHAFDRNTLEGGRIVVRRAHEGEEMRTLDGTLRSLDPSDLLITDGNKPVALAAIMGGLESEVAPETTDVLLEAANFEPIGILRTSERLAIRTEGSNRWEKGVDPYAAESAAILASRLIVDLAGGKPDGQADRHAGLPARPVVRLRTARTDRVVGLEVAPSEQRAILERIGCDVSDVSDSFEVTAPTWRARDLTREIDLIEEVARVVLDRVPRTMPLRRLVAGHLTKEQRLRRLVEDVLVGAGFFEAYTWSLVDDDLDPGALRLPQPMAAEQAILRTSLLRGLVEAAAVNIDAGNESIRLFELARVYLPTGEQLPDERWRVGGIAAGGFASARGAVETIHESLHLPLSARRGALPFLHPGKAAETEAGWFGELHPTLLAGDWGVFELDLAALIEPIPDRVLYDDVIAFPSLRQDLAIVVADAVEAQTLIEEVRAAGGPDVRDVRVFDVYRGAQVGDGMKSVALHVVFQSAERTLTDDDAAALRERILAALAKRLGAELRA